MSLLAKIHALWAADAGLTALVPASRVFTGRVPHGVALPYVRIEQPATASHLRSSNSRTSDVQIRFHLWTDVEQFAVGESIQAAIEAAYLDYHGTLADGARIVDVQLGAEYSEQEEDATDKAWHFITTIAARIVRARTR